VRIRPLKLLKWLLAIALLVYAGGVAVLYVVQRDLLYVPPQTVRTPPAAVDFPAQEVILDTSDGEKVIAWHLPAQAGKFVIIYFHGNGDVLALRVPRLREIFADGTGLVALSFRGYAAPRGTPLKPGCLPTRRLPTTLPPRAVRRSTSSSGASRSAPDRRSRSPPRGRSASSSWKRPIHRRPTSPGHCCRSCRSGC
jgi:hypothetical protein